MEVIQASKYRHVVDDICKHDWGSLTEAELTDAAWAYYFFSVQFRENLEIACELFPNDPKLQQLEQEECNTNNLSPWPGVADTGERMNHDEFMARSLKLSPINAERKTALEAAGQAYLRLVRETPHLARALSIASYEDGGLEQVFRAFLTAQYWNTPLLRAFKHFLTEHIRFDSDPEQGHGALSRHLTPDDRILPLWSAFDCLLVQAVPRLSAARAGGVE